jgi:hypothetical protein
MKKEKKEYLSLITMLSFNINLNLQNNYEH